MTGVLPIALGRATRIVQVLLSAGKEYITIMHLHKKIGKERVKEVFKEFTGKIRQKPPIRSAVRRVERTRQIYYFDILEMQEQDVLFKVGCEAGTYIRKLCHQIGERLECGAHMSELRRTKAGPFTEETLSTLQDLQDAFYYYKKEDKEKYLRKIIQPVENAVNHLPKIWVLDSTVESLCHGTDLKIPGIAKLNDKINNDNIVAILSLKNELIALGSAKSISGEMIKKEKGMAVETEKVFMEPGTYNA